MIPKRILVPNRLRRPPATGWSWTDGRFVREHMDHLSREAVLLYFFLSAVADVNGLSFYGDGTVAARLRVPLPSLLQARDELLAYIVDLMRASRKHESVLVGAGPRATQSLLLASRAAAAIAGRDFVTPDDIKAMALPVLEHRLILRPEFEIEGMAIAEVIQKVLQQVTVPR